MNVNRHFSLFATWELGFGQGYFPALESCVINSPHRISFRSHPWQALRRRLLRTPLFYKILVANLAIVAFGAIVGTIITVWHVRTYPDDVHYELIGLFAAAGVTLSFVVNHWVLKRALAPLDCLQDAVDQVRSGNPSACRT